MINYYDIYRGCPEAISDNIKQLFFKSLSLNKVSFLSENSSNNAIYSTLTDAKISLSSIFNIFSSMIFNEFKPKDDWDKVLVLKLYDDLGEIESNIARSTNHLNQNTKEYAMFGLSYQSCFNLMNYFESIILRPLAVANRKNMEYRWINHNDLKKEEYFKIVFNTLSANASILAQAIKLENKQSPNSGSKDSSFKSPYAMFDKYGIKPTNPQGKVTISKGIRNVKKEEDEDEEEDDEYKEGEESEEEEEENEEPKKINPSPRKINSRFREKDEVEF